MHWIPYGMRSRITFALVSSKLRWCGIRPTEVRVVLISPEPLDLVVHDALAQHIAGGSSAFLDGVLPMFHSDPTIENRVVRYVTCGVNAVDVRLAVFNYEDSVVHVNAASILMGARVVERVVRAPDIDQSDSCATHIDCRGAAHRISLVLMAVTNSVAIRTPPRG
jgi:hypothetical protein